MQASTSTVASVSTDPDLPIMQMVVSEIGEFIREQRRNAHVSLRQLAQKAGVSNPYLSQIERGIRKPSAEVLSQIATALRISTSVMFSRAGLLQAQEGADVATAIAGDSALTPEQKRVLIEIYQQFRSTTQALSDPGGPFVNGGEAALGELRPKGKSQPKSQKQPIEEPS